MQPKQSISDPIYAQRALRRLLTQVDATPGYGPNGDCHLWQGTRRGKNGYGAFGLEGKSGYAHRAAYLLTHGPIPNGYVVMHKCDVRFCVNPDHLKAGTQQENIQDARAKGRIIFGLRNMGINSGALNAAAKITESDVRRIRTMNLKGRQEMEPIANELGIHWKSVWCIATGRLWKHIH